MQRVQGLASSEADAYRGMTILTIIAIIVTKATNVFLVQSMNQVLVSVIRMHISYNS